MTPDNITSIQASQILKVPGKTMKYLLIIITLIGLAGCQTTLPEKDPRMAVAGHVNESIPQPSAVEDDIPPVVSQVPVIAAPKPAEKLQTFTVVAADLPASELLFALARDARLNLDIDPAISGNVSINAIDQTLPQILKRISNQVSLRYYVDGPNMVVKRDLPFMRTYKIDYLNMARETKSSVSIDSKIATGGSVEGGSTTSIKNTSSNDFWKTLETNLLALAQSDGQPGQVISNRESGTINVMSSSKGHESIGKFLDSVMTNVRKQVLIEATVVEVTLNDEFQAGVDWSRLASGNGWDIVQSTLSGNLASGQFLSATFSDKQGSTDISASIKALDAFGNVSVMSSPKIMALNNQTSVLKVVDNRVYFTNELKTTDATATSPSKETLTTTIHTVPVGFIMNVTPYITSNDEVILNIRPTISRILQFIDLPTLGGGVASKIPEISVREMESVLRVGNGNTAVIGGLMQDSTNKKSAGVPGLHDTSGFGVLFGTQEQKSSKTELVIFLRPRIIGNASLETNLKDFKRFLKPKLLAE
jgi:general secretion pathway protein D